MCYWIKYCILGILHGIWIIFSSPNVLHSFLHGSFVLSWTACCMDCMLHGLKVAWTAGCMDCRLHGLQFVWTEVCMDCRLYGLQVAWTAGCVDCRLHELQVAWTAGCMDCSLHGLSAFVSLQKIHAFGRRICCLSQG